MTYLESGRAGCSDYGYRYGCEQLEPIRWTFFVDPSLCDLQSPHFISNADIADDDLASGITLEDEIGAPDWRRCFTPRSVRLGFKYDHVLLLHPAGL